MLEATTKLNKNYVDTLQLNIHVCFDDAPLAQIDA